MHALIIEQDTWIVLMIEDALRGLGYTSFDFADCPQEAVAAATLRRPDLITAALRLGTGNGVDAVREICIAQTIPVLFVTATPWEIREVDPEAAIVAKPFGRDSLQQGVARAIAAPVACRPVQAGADESAS